jgi:hypothetical protein
VKSLSADLDARTAARITPRLQAFSDATQRLATARARQQQVELVLRQWDRADDIGAVAGQLRAERETLRTALAGAQATFDSRREEILAGLNEEFRDTVTALGIPGVQTATIHPTNYLPLLNGRPFATFSSGGGIVTAAQVAYWTSLLAVALRRGDTFYPRLLIIDSPRLALNEAEALSVALYRGWSPRRTPAPARCSSSSPTISCPPATVAITPRSTSPTMRPPYRPSATPAPQPSGRSLAGKER